MASADSCYDISDLDSFVLSSSSFLTPLDKYGNGFEDDGNGESFPDIPISYDDLTHQLYHGLMVGARVIWWPILPHIPSSQPLITTYPKMKENSIKRYVWVRERALSTDSQEMIHQNDYKTLQEVNQSRYYEIVLLLSEMIDFDQILMKQLITMVIHVIPSNDICFHLCSTILTSRKGYWVASNYNEHQFHLQIFYEIMKTYLIQFPSFEITFDQLISYRILDDVFLNHIFLNLFTTLLPIGHCLRIMDMFLLEGKIVLYRFGMGLIYHYLHLLNEQDAHQTCRYRNGKAFWSEVAMRSQTLPFTELFETTIQIGNKSFLRSLLSFASPPQLEFRLTAADLPDFEAQAKLDLQHPLKRRQSLTGILSDSLPTSLRLFNSLLYTSRYFTTNSLSLLFSSFPLSSLQSVDHFTLSFATYHHGYSLHSLYKLTAYYSPTILLLRSLESKVVIGVYLDDTISPPGNQMRGKGKGGVFRLDEQKCIWYGTATEKLRKENEKEYCELQRRRLSIDEVSEIQTTETEDDNSKLSAEMTSVATDGKKAPRSQVDPNDMDDIYYQYCISQLDALIFGGSAEHGTNAIRICSDLRTCSAGPSDTYQNLPLVPEESDPFLIEDVEVFCGHMAMEDFIERHYV